MDDEPKFLKRKVHAGDVDVHPTDCAIVVNYEVCPSPSLSVRLSLSPSLSDLYVFL